MSFCICLKCYRMVPSYDKHCSDCQKKYGFANLPNWQKENSSREHFDDWAKKEEEKDMAKIKAVGKQADKTKQAELLSILEAAFTHLLRGTNYKKTRVKYKQAEAKIMALIKKEVPNG